jgi:hypothetical protein
MSSSLSGSPTVSAMETARTRLPTELPLDSYTLPRRPWRRYVTSFEDILDHHYKGSGTEADPYVVDWLRDDAEDPQNFPAAFKWAQVLLTSLLTLAVTLASSGYAGGVQSLMAEFGGSSELWVGGVCEYSQLTRARAAGRLGLPIMQQRLPL